MPAFLEHKFQKEYGKDSSIPYKVMNKLGAMHGNKETAKGKRMEKKHAMATKMHSSIHKAEVKNKKKHYERVMNDFNKHGKERHEENMWKYARLNPTSDKRIF